MMFILDMATIEEKHITAFDGKKIESRGKCAIIYKVVIIIQSFFIDKPKANDRKRLLVIAPVIMSLAPLESVLRATASALK